MTSSGSIAVSRAIVGALQPLQGPAAAGKLLVHSTTPTGTVGKGAVAIPIVGGSLLEGAAVFVKAETAVTSGGVLVDVEALSGGPLANLPAGTQYHWLPELDGIEPVSVSAAGGLSGGSLTVILRRVVQFKNMDRADLQALFAAQVNEYPAAILIWAGTQPTSGPLASSTGPRSSRAGRGNVMFRHLWLLWLLTSNLSTEATRRREADVLRDAVIGELHQRIATRNNALRVSGEPGLEIIDAAPRITMRTLYVDEIKMGTTYAQTKLFRPDQASYPDWLSSHIRVQTDEQAGSKIDIPDIIVPME